MCADAGGFDGGQHQAATLLSLADDELREVAEPLAPWDVAALAATNPHLRTLFQADALAACEAWAAAAGGAAAGPTPGLDRARRVLAKRAARRGLQVNYSFRGLNFLYL